MRSFFFSFCLCFLNIGLVFSQEILKTDSLLSELGNAKDDSTRFELLKRIAFSHPDPVQSLLFANDAYDLAKKINSPIATARALEEVSLSHRTLGNKAESFQAAFEALGIYDSLGMRKHQATQYIQIGSNYTLEEEFKLAIRYLLKGCEIHQSLDRSKDVAIAEVNIGETYRLMGHLDSARWYTDRALTYGKEYEEPLIIGYALGNLGMIYSENEQLQKAVNHLTASIDIMTELGDPYSVSVYLSELGSVFERQGDDQRCLSLLNHAYKLATDNGLKEQIRDISNQLASFFETRGVFDQALRYTKVYETYEDSLVNLKNIKSIEQLKAQYEYGKRDREIARKQAEIENGLYVRNVTFIISGLLAVIVVISLYAFIRKQKDNKLLALQKDEISERELQKQWLLGELQHRTKNNLQMISSLLNLQSRQLVGHPSYEAIKEGQSRVDALAIIHQRLYQEGSQLKINMKDNLIELVESLVHSFNAKVITRFQIDMIDLDVDKAIPLALVVNELVTNALKHAYDDVEEPRLLVGLKKLDDGSVGLEVLDNGHGMDGNHIEDNQSFGLGLVKSLVQQIRATIQHKMTPDGFQWEIKLQTHAIS